MMRRVATRFAVVYFALYAVGTPIISYLLTLPDGRYVEYHTASRLVSWVGAHAFGVGPLNQAKGSGDRLFDWVQLATFAGIALIASSLWMLMDRRQRDPDDGRQRERLEAWLRLGLRFALGGVLMFYGASKVVPIQMPPPDLMRLLQPVGALSPEQLFWTQFGAAPLYESFTGCVEVAAAMLLFVPALASMGAALAGVALVNVFAIDVAYDIPVKLWAFHLLVMAAILIAPDVPRLSRVLLHRPVGESASQAPLFGRMSACRLAVAAQILFGVYVTGVCFVRAHVEWRDRDRANGAMGPLYGAWNVDRMTIDGLPQPLTMNATDAWRRIVFEQGAAYFQRMDETSATYTASVDVATHVVTLTREPIGPATLAFAQPAPGRLVLDGCMDGRIMHVELRGFGRDSFPLITHGIHWKQEAPTGR